MSTAMPARRLPDGTTTKSVRTFTKAWDEIIHPLEERLGVRVYGFDPGFLVQDKETGRSAEIPMWMAKRIVEQTF